jgi:hypothetical protein
MAQKRVKVERHQIDITIIHTGNNKTKGIYESEGPLVVGPEESDTSESSCC